jgi:hypothetical protein
VLAVATEPWSYIKFSYLNDIGWKGFEEGPQSGIFAVAPLARLNAADAMATPKAQAAKGLIHCQHLTFYQPRSLPFVPPRRLQTSNGWGRLRLGTQSLSTERRSAGRTHA